MNRSALFVILILLFTSNCRHQKMAKADDKMALTHKIIWDYVDTYNDLYPKLKPPQVKYRREADNAYFNETRTILYLSTYQQLSRSFKKRLEEWSVESEPAMSAKELYENWYMIMDLSAALSWYLMDHVGAEYFIYRKQMQDIYILSWLFLRENDFYGKEEKEWVNIIKHINKQARNQLSPEDLMINLNNAFIKSDQSRAFYTYYSSLGMLKSHQMSKKLQLTDILALFKNRKENME